MFISIALILMIFRILLTTIGKNTGERDQNKTGIEFLANTALGLTVKDCKQIIIGQIQFFKRPSFMVEIGKGLNSIAAAGERGR